MNNQMLSNINSLVNGQSGLSDNPIGQYDLSDKTFSNMLDKKLQEGDNAEEVKEFNAVEKLGMPIGMVIEGFDYNSSFSEISNSTEKIEEINTETNIKDDNKFDVKSLINNVKNTILPIAETLTSAGMDLQNGDLTNAITTLKNFKESQATNIYNLMNKENINDLSALVSKL